MDIAVTVLFSNIGNSPDIFRSQGSPDHLQTQRKISLLFLAHESALLKKIVIYSFFNFIFSHMFIIPGISSGQLGRTEQPIIFYNCAGCRFFLIFNIIPIYMIGLHHITYWFSSFLSRLSFSYRS